MKRPPASAKKPSATSQGGMLLTREQHRKLAEAYSNPDPDWSPDEVAKAAELAKVHAALGREPDPES